MSNFNLTNQKIKDTYEQLAQIGTSSLLLDGTGSIVTSLEITAATASKANTVLHGQYTGGDARYLMFTDTLTGYDFPGVDPKLTYTATTHTLEVTASQATSASYAPTNLPSGVVSSSAQTIENIDGQIITALIYSSSAGLIRSVGNDLEIRQTKAASNVVLADDGGNANLRVGTANVTLLAPATASFVSSSDGFIGDLTGTASYATNADTLDGIQASAFAQTSNNNSFSGTQTFNNISVNGTGSFAYIESVTGSAKIIGDAYIVLNNNTPAERYAGVKVFDSGSTNNSASLEFDGQTNDWFYEYTDDGGATLEFGAVMFGPGYNTKGSHVYPSNNTILKGTGDHHIVDSNITDDGTSVTVSTSLTASAFQGNLSGNVTGDLTGTASFATNALTASHALNVPVTASYALSASAADTFTISDTLALGSSTITVDSASATGSLIDNIHPAIASGSTAIKHIVTIDQTAYDTISGSGDVSNDTFYIISDAGDNVYPENLQVDGQVYSPAFAGTVASSTSSIDFNNGNFATLSLTSATFLANPSNLKSGTTYTIIFEQSGSHVSGYGSAFLFAGGTEPTLSDGKDVLTMVSDGTNLFATALTEFS